MPGVVGCSHHFGRWRLNGKEMGNRWTSALADIKKEGTVWSLRFVQTGESFNSKDPDSNKNYRNENGVHQNLTFAPHPDPLSGMHCWHQKVKIEKARPEDRYGDVVVDTDKSFEVYKNWLKMTKIPAGNLRRPLWLPRPFRPDISAYQINT